MIKNRKMSHGGGGRAGGVGKGPKKCHVLFEWPHTTYVLYTFGHKNSYAVGLQLYFWVVNGCIFSYRIFLFPTRVVSTLFASLAINNQFDENKLKVFGPSIIDIRTFHNFSTPLNFGHFSYVFE
jgi:hypothetical protein